ncbi:hypothetical protein AABB24_014944 [Solanum stoloniferum]|uniref:Hydroxyproline-rich glycoprotein family protein n=2 Tax=Solanum TaxID=4107 RepID=A0AAF0UDD5_SOLVR|nr:uncharacterized protein LOC125826205 [Solanum verrucosum]WMV43912.1 hypothetical protein MTR67_037297 [Solanum verrucosum]
MSRVNGEQRGVDSTLETINAAAIAIASVENRVPQASIQKRRWGGCWSMYWCFGSHKQTKRIGHAVFIPETTASGADRPSSNTSSLAPSIVLPFIAPPSSPASFLPSEPPSATHSPVGSKCLSMSTYSPSGPTSIFAIGPYAHETQLVSPPVFSAFNTEPSTAPFTPPPESVHLTTPSSPEVPFAKLLDPNYQNVAAGHRYPFAQYEFQSYQLQPGSPVSNLISPGSAISVSGTSSPFLDREYTPGRPQFLNLEKIAPHEWGSRQGSGTLTPEAVNPKYHDSFLLNYQNSGVHRLPKPFNGWKNDLTVVDHRVSFEITAEDVVRCVEKKPTMMMRTGSVSLQDTESSTKRQENLAEMSNGHDHGGHEPSREIHEGSSTDGEDGQRQQKHRSITLGSSKEFNFDNVDGGYPDKATIGSDWWANEKVLGKEPCNNWIFPMMQPGVS